MKEEEANKTIKADRDGTVNDSMKQATPAQMRAMQDQARKELKDYKDRLTQSVALKELQVREIELNIKFYNVSKEYEVIRKLMQEEEAVYRAQEAKKAKIPEFKVGKPRKEESVIDTPDEKTRA